MDNLPPKNNGLPKPPPRTSSITVHPRSTSLPEAKPHELYPSTLVVDTPPLTQAPIGSLETPFIVLTASPLHLPPSRSLPITPALEIPVVAAIQVTDYGPLGPPPSALPAIPSGMPELGAPPATLPPIPSEMSAPPPRPSAAPKPFSTPRPLLPPAQTTAAEEERARFTLGPIFRGAPSREKATVIPEKAKKPKLLMQKLSQANFQTLNLFGKASVYAPLIQCKFTPAEFQYFKEKYLARVTRSDSQLLRANAQAAQLLNTISLDDFLKELNSIRVISLLPADQAIVVGFNRDLYHVPPYPPALEELNLELIGSKGSVVRLGGGGDNPYIQPTAQVSILQRLTMRTGDKTVKVWALSLAAPALDDRSIIFTTDEDGVVNKASFNQKSLIRPEMETYIDTSTYPPTFKIQNYETAYATLKEHILAGVQACDPQRVILSAFGVNNFLGALETIDSRTKQTDTPTNFVNTAQEIAAKSLAQTIKEIRAQDKEVYFSDIYQANAKPPRYGSENYWAKVNAHLAQLGEKPLEAINGKDSSLGADWLQEGTDMIVNAWDPDSIVGNGMLLDSSFDGWLGRLSTVHAIHVLACLMMNGALKLE